MTRVAIVQSNYIPWRGYFSLISSCDVFVILDSVRYTKRDWRNRNQLRERDGLFWLTIPVKKESTRESIYDVRVSDPSWVSRHLTSIRHSLVGLPFYECVRDSIEPVYRSLESEASLHAVNMTLIRTICDITAIRSTFLVDSDISTLGARDREIDPTERLIEICAQVGSTSYLTGPRGIDYLDLDSFRKAKIRIEVADYSKMSPYRQKFTGFVPYVSVLDFIAAVGPADASIFFQKVSIA